MSDSPQELLQETLVRDLLYTSPVALLVVDDEMRILVANEAAAKLSGYSISELTQLQSWQITGDPEQSARNAEHAACLRPAHRRILIEKCLQCLIVLEELKEKFDRHTGTAEYGDASQLFRIAFDEFVSVHPWCPRVRRSRGRAPLRTPPGPAPGAQKLFLFTFC